MDATTIATTIAHNGGFINSQKPFKKRRESVLDFDRILCAGWGIRPKIRPNRADMPPTTTWKELDTATLIRKILFLIVAGSFCSLPGVGDLMLGKEVIYPLVPVPLKSGALSGVASRPVATLASKESRPDIEVEEVVDEGC